MEPQLVGQLCSRCTNSAELYTSSANLNLIMYCKVVVGLGNLRSLVVQNCHHQAGPAKALNLSSLRRRHRLRHQSGHTKHIQSLTKRGTRTSIAVPEIHSDPPKGQSNAYCTVTVF